MQLERLLLRKLKLGTMEATVKKIIIVNGPMGVGKTTVGKLICNKLGRAAFIDGDWCLDIHPFVGNKETKAMAIDNILYMAKTTIIVVSVIQLS